MWLIFACIGKGITDIIEELNVLHAIEFVTEHLKDLKKVILISLDTVTQTYGLHITSTYEYLRSSKIVNRSLRRI